MKGLFFFPRKQRKDHAYEKGNTTHHRRRNADEPSVYTHSIRHPFSTAGWSAYPRRGTKGR